MEVALKKEWNESIEEKVTNWTKTYLNNLLNENPDDDLINYIAVMIGNKKKMIEIHSELKELIDEEKSS